MPTRYVGSGGAGEVGEEDAFDIADGAAEHGSDEERGSEHAAGRAADEGERGGENLENGEDSEHFPGELAVHGLVHGVVTGAHDLGKAKEADETDEESGEGGLEVLRPARKRFEDGTQIADGFGEGNRGEAADDAEHSVGDEFDGRLKVVTGMRKSGSLPRNQRTMTTLETAERTTEPRMPALQRPMTSSMTKRTAEIGALKAAARPAAAPTGAMRRSFSREIWSWRPRAEAMLAPIWREGSSGPRDWPEPMASAAQMNFPTAVRKGMKPLKM